MAPAPVIHFADKTSLNMYNETRNIKGKVIKNGKELLTTQLIHNYMFGHPNSSVVLFPYSSNVAYINHHSTKFNAQLQWATDFEAHNQDWLHKDVTFLEQQWRAGENDSTTPCGVLSSYIAKESVTTIRTGLMLEFVATRDILEGEEIFIDYGDRWQTAWDQHVKDWTPVDPSKDYNNYTHCTKLSTENTEKTLYKRAETFKIEGIPIRTIEEQEINPYPRNVVTKCRVDLDIGIGNYTHAPKTTPHYKREYVEDDFKKGDKSSHQCNILKRKGMPRISFDDDDVKETSPFVYTVQIDRKKRQHQGMMTIEESHVITDVPTEAINLVNEKYTSDMFLKSAFRHEMELPDGLWPNAWMNLIQKQ